MSKIKLYLKFILFVNFVILNTSCKQDVYYNLSVSSNVGGSAVPTSGTYIEGQRVTLIATPSNDYNFFKWNGDVNSTENPFSLLMDNNKTIIANFVLKDTDLDSVADIYDKCPNTPEGLHVDSTGCALSQRDSDSDKITDDLDLCPNTVQGNIVDANGCSISQRDTDGDGFNNSVDECPNTTIGEKVNSHGCSSLESDCNFENLRENILIEAEDYRFGRTTEFSNLAYINVQSSYSDSTSGSKYLMVTPTTVSSSTLSSVTFPIPNTLKGKYNVYVVFVSNPLSTTNLSYKVKFYITYVDENKKEVSDLPIGKNNEVLSKNNVAATFADFSKNYIRKYFITQYNFPFCNYFDEVNPNTFNIKFKIKILNAALITETAIFDRTLRIDYLILEAVN